MNNDIFQERKNKTLDTHRKVALEKRHSKGYRTARENLNALVDADSFIEYGQLAVAAQRNRREIKRSHRKYSCRWNSYWFSHSKFARFSKLKYTNSNRCE